MQLFLRRLNTSLTHKIESQRTGSGLRLLTVTGLLLLVGYIAYFLLLQSPSIWATSNLVAERWPNFYSPIKDSVMTFLGQVNGSGDFGLLNSRLYHLLLIILFAIYLFAVFRAFRSAPFSRKSTKAPLRIILAVTAAILGVLVFIPGVFSGDLLAYVWYGRVFAVHGGNPYIDVPALYVAREIGDWAQHVSYPDLVSPYGPVWAILAGNLSMFSRMIDDHIVTHLLSHKLLAAAIHLVNTAILWHVAREVIARYWPIKSRAKERVQLADGTQLPVLRERNSWQLGAQVGITLAYAWNPLLLLEFGMNGHNDGPAILTLLAALWLHLAGRWRWAVLVLALAGLVKLTEALTFTGPYLAFLFWETRKSTGISTKQFLIRRAARLGQAVAIIAAVWVVAWLPFWRGPDTLRIYTQNPSSLYYIHSLGTVIRFTVPYAVDRMADDNHWAIADSWNAQTIGESLDKPTRYGLQAIAALVALLFMWRARTFRAMLVALWWTVFAYLAIGSIWFWPWYTSWLVLPMALLGPGRLFTAGQIRCVTSLAVYGLNPSTSGLFAWWWAWSGLIINGPPLLYLLTSSIISLVRRRRKRRERLRVAPAAV